MNIAVNMMYFIKLHWHGVIPFNPTFHSSGGHVN